VWPARDRAARSRDDGDGKPVNDALVEIWQPTRTAAIRTRRQPRRALEPRSKGSVACLRRRWPVSLHDDQAGRVPRQGAGAGAHINVTIFMRGC